MAMPADAVSTWSCTVCLAAAVEVSASTAGIILLVVTAIIVGRASIVTQTVLLMTVVLAEVSLPPACCHILWFPKIL